MRSISFDIDERLERKIKKITVLKRVNAEMTGAPIHDFDLEGMLRDVLNRVVDDILREEAEIDADLSAPNFAPSPQVQAVQNFQAPPQTVALTDDPVTQHKLSSTPADKPTPKKKKAAAAAPPPEKQEELSLTETDPQQTDDEGEEVGIEPDFFSAVESNVGAAVWEENPDPEEYATRVAASAPQVKTGGRKALGRGMEEAFMVNQAVTPAAKSFNAKKPRVRVSHATTDN
jgi:hypothetical protein